MWKLLANSAASPIDQSPLAIPGSFKVYTHLSAWMLLAKPALL